MTGSCCVVQYGLEPAAQPSLVSNLQTSCLNLLNARIIGMWHDTRLYATNLSFYYIYRLMFSKLLPLQIQAWAQKFSNLHVRHYLILDINRGDLHRLQGWYVSFLFFFYFWYYNYIISLSPSSPQTLIYTLPYSLSNSWPFFINKLSVLDTILWSQS